MCYLDKYDLVYPDGTWVPQRRVIPCVHGTAESPCTRTVERRQLPVHTVPFTPAPAAGGPQYVQIAPAMARSNTTAGPSLRERRRRDDIRLDFEVHIPFTSRGDKKERSPRRYPVSAGYGPAPPPPPHAVPVEYYQPGLAEQPAHHQGHWQEWHPRIVNIDPAAATPPATPRSSHRSRSAGPSPIGGREHLRGHSRQRSDASSARRQSRTASPAPATALGPRLSAEERAQRVAEINERIGRLRRERELAREGRENRAREERIGELERRILELQRDLRRFGPSRVVETHHPDGRRTTREALAPPQQQQQPPRGGAGGGRNDFLRHSGRSAIQRDIQGRDADRASGDEGEGRRRSSRPRAASRARIAAPGDETNTFARMLGFGGRRSESRRRDRQTERLVYAGEGPRPHRWH